MPLVATSPIVYHLLFTFSAVPFEVVRLGVNCTLRNFCNFEDFTGWMGKVVTESIRIKIDTLCRNAYVRLVCPAIRIDDCNIVFCVVVCHRCIIPLLSAFAMLVITYSGKNSKVVVSPLVARVCVTGRRASVP